MQSRVIDVIFFPENNVDPMVRVDGDNLPQNQIVDLECSEKNVLVRDPELAGSLSKNDFKKLSIWAKDQKRDIKCSYRFNKELLTATKLFLSSVKNNINNQHLWELDCDKDQIVIRIINDLAKRNYKKNLSKNIRLEVYRSFKVEDANNLLLVRHFARKAHKPFFVFLNDLLLK
jgi:hypothetical protein